MSDQSSYQPLYDEGGVDTADGVDRNAESDYRSDDDAYDEDSSEDHNHHAGGLQRIMEEVDD